MEHLKIAINNLDGEFFAPQDELVIRERLEKILCPEIISKINKEGGYFEVKTKMGMIFENPMHKNVSQELSIEIVKKISMHKDDM